MRSVGFGVIGCGGRLRSLVELLARRGADRGIRLVAAWDPDAGNLEALASAYEPWGQDAVRCSSCNEVLEHPALEWVLVGSPNSRHAEQIIAAFGAGKHVFAEKPLATELDDCVRILAEQGRSGKLFATGFTLRYSPLYRKAKELIASGKIGKIVSIDATENLFPFHGAYIMTNWRRFREEAGANILEKCVHDLDILNWITDSLPLRVAAFGGNSMFVPEHAHLFAKVPSFSDWPTVGASGLNPFTAEKTIEDNMVTILEYANGVRAQFQATMSNPIGERRMYVSGVEGTLKLDLVTSELCYRTLWEPDMHVFPGLGGNNMHGGGDEVMIDELIDSMLTGAVPACGGAEGLRSAVVGISLERAYKESRIVDLRDTWRRLGVPIPEQA